MKGDIWRRCGTIPVGLRRLCAPHIWTALRVHMQKIFQGRSPHGAMPASVLCLAHHRGYGRTPHTFCSAGHYFRSQYGADYAGVDVVLHQIKPFCGEEKHIAPIADGYADPLFFDNTLAKLASSCSHIDKSKRGALCEIFGAYGWAEGSEEMLWLANHMLVRGINLFIPHAFSSVYPNDDCPPYFMPREKTPPILPIKY